MLIVSLTTIRSRLNYVSLVIDSLTNQSLQPDLIILSVSSDPYLLDEGILEKDLPQEVLLLRDRGRVIISLVANSGPYRKLLPLAVGLNTTDAILVTADDDIVYPRRWLEGLVKAHLATGRSTAYRARAMCVRGARLRPYHTWKMARPNGEGNYGEIHQASRRLLTLPTGCDGILYRASWFQNTALLSRLQSMAPRQDDFAFRFLLIAQGIETEIVPRIESGIETNFQSAGRTQTSLFQSNKADNTTIFRSIFRFLARKNYFDLRDHYRDGLLAPLSETSTDAPVRG